MPTMRCLDDSVRLAGSGVQNGNNFYRQVLWSPDGLYLLSMDNQRNIELYTTVAGCDSPASKLNRVLHRHESENIYDIKWFPQMTVYDPATCCLLLSTRDHPVKMWDICTQTVRCSYTIVNHVEEIMAPHSLLFDDSGGKIYAGFRDSTVRLLDVQRPGSDCCIRSIKLHPHHIKGIISAMDQRNNMLACGSFGGQLAVYDSLQPSAQPCHKLETVKYGRSIGHGVTQLKFNLDTNEWLLFSASRKSNTIHCWDLRYTNDILFAMDRPTGKTNQRVFFDLITPSQLNQSTGASLLVTGTASGELRAFDCLTGEPKGLLNAEAAHQDLISSVAVNPTHDSQLLATCSGQRSFLNHDDSFISSNATVSDISIKLWKMEA